MNYSIADFVKRLEVNENILTQLPRQASTINARNNMICIRNKTMLLNKIKRLGFAIIEQATNFSVNRQLYFRNSIFFPAPQAKFLLFLEH